jgi:uncharacterized protein
MTTTGDDTILGTVAQLRRYPVKSMLGEEPASCRLDASGITGDRRLAVVDGETGKVASAKDPRRWGSLLECSARFDDATVVVRLPDGTETAATDPLCAERLSEFVGRSVEVASVSPAGATYDDVWPDVDGLAPDDFIESTRIGTDPDGLAVSAMAVGALAPGTFQDLAPLTVLTTASLRAAQAAGPDSDWDARRFRMNLLLDVDGAAFVENEWSGRRLGIGTAVIETSVATPRCVMTTLGHSGLVRDRSVLQTLARHNRIDVAGLGRFACLGAYATVVRPGTVSVGDAVLAL